MLRRPLSISTLNQAAEWMNEAYSGNQPWTAFHILDAALEFDQRTPDFHPPTCIEATPPADTKFALVHLEPLVEEQPGILTFEREMPFQTIELYPYQLRQLLDHAETTAIQARGPHETLAGEYVMVMPVGETVKVSFSMLRIRRRQLESLAEALNLSDAKMNPPLKCPRSKWTDEDLRILWHESIAPGATHQILAQKHGVTRQRMGALVKRATVKFRPNSSVAPMAIFAPKVSLKSRQ